MNFEGKFFQNDSGEIEIKKYKTGFVTIKTSAEFVVNEELRRRIAHFLVSPFEEAIEYEEAFKKEIKKPKKGIYQEEKDKVGYDIEEAELDDEETEEEDPKQLKVLNTEKKKKKKFFRKN